MLYLSPRIFNASFYEISCLIVFPVFRFTLALASYNFVCEIPQLVCFKCKSWQAAHLKCFCSSWLLQIQNQQAALWNYLAPCKWTSAIATLPPTRFGENHWHAVSTCKRLQRVAIVCERRVKISPVWVTAAIWFFKAAFTRASFSCENRHFAFFLSQIALITYTAQDLRKILSARYRQTRPPKNQIAAVTHTGEILTRCSHTIATTWSHSHVETACQCFSQNRVGGRVAIAWFTYTVRDSFKARLAGFEFTKANCRKSTSNAPLVSFCVWNNHALEFWEEIVWSQCKRKTKYREYN